MEDLKALLTLMFEPEDEIAVGAGPWAYHSMPQATVLSGEVPLISSNQTISVHTVKTEELTLLCINAVKGYRSDKNITSCRNFLFELDIGSLSSQSKYVKSLNLPTSASIFSGNKSIHTLVCLDQVVDIKLYRKMYQWALNIGTLFDQNCKNPSRCVRIPGNIRPDTNRKQRFIELKSRVKLEEFMAWLNSHPNEEPKEREERKDLTNEKNYERISMWARLQLRDGIDFSNGRNKAYFGLACDLAKSGYSEESAENLLGHHFVEEHDFKYKEFLAAIKSAFTYMANKGS